MDNQSKKIRLARKRLNRLETKYKKLITELDRLRIILTDYKRLTHREECPLCRQKIHSKYFEEQIPIIVKKMKVIEAWITTCYNYKKRFKIRTPITKLEEQQKREWKRKVNIYWETNKAKFNKTILTFALPTTVVSDEEKKLWNDAMNLQLDKRGLEEEDEFFYQF